MKKMKKMKKIFLGGCPRSGTTMLGAILGNGNKCICTPESQFKFISDRAILNDRTKVLNLIANNWRFRIWGSNLDELKDHGTNTGYEDLIEQIVQIYAKEHNKADSCIWIDHTPENIENIDFIFSEFENVKFINVIRDPRGVYASFKETKWGILHPKEFAWFWLKFIAVGQLIKNTLPDDSYFEVRFEDVLLDPKIKISEISEFVNIDFSETMIQGNDFDVPSFSKGQHKLVNRKPSKTKIDDWKSRLSKREIELIEFYTEPVLSQLGYVSSSNGGVQMKRWEEMLWFGKKMIRSIQKRVFIINNFR